MVEDMKTRLMSIENDLRNYRRPPSQIQVKTWTIYVKEIEFHLGIIGYLLNEKRVLARKTGT